jgi:hypothetical protein
VAGQDELDARGAKRLDDVEVLFAWTAKMRSTPSFSSALTNRSDAFIGSLLK